MSNYTISGTVSSVGDVQTFPSGFSKRTLVVMTDEKYPQRLPIDFLKERASLLDSVHEGDAVSVSFDFRSNESKVQRGRYFISLTGWKVDILPSAAPAVPEQPPTDGYVDMSEDVPF